MSNQTEYCLNCGHESHCGENCYKDYGESEKTLCCTHCRCEKDEIDWEDEVKFYLLDEDSFNGA